MPSTDLPRFDSKTRSAKLLRSDQPEWTCDQQAEIEAASPLDHMLIAEQQGWQLEDEVVVNEQGFDRWDGQVFETRDVFEAWLRSPVPVV